MAGKETNNDLPDTVDLTLEEIEKYYPVWAWWVATDRKHLLSDILSEPAEVTSIVLEIDDLYHRIVEQLNDDGEQEG